MLILVVSHIAIGAVHTYEIFPVPARALGTQTRDNSLRAQHHERRTRGHMRTLGGGEMDDGAGRAVRHRAVTHLPVLAPSPKSQCARCRPLCSTRRRNARCPPKA